MLPQLDPSTGLLPPGRYLATLAEVELEFVLSSWAAASSSRRDIWSEFGQALSQFRALADPMLLTCWLGGSFTTRKTDPDDIDVLLVLDAGQFDASSNTLQAKVRSFVGRDGPLPRLRTKKGLRVDAHALFSRSVLMPWKGLVQADADYFQARGMWDDWWLRHRTVPKGAPPTPACCASSRGYVEVLL